jgi:chromosome segregation protein
MLKALELSGFKSFAEKTRFEFPAGITVVVGPNGSGKSNIVDAIKWVLGEQSAKSLRGKDMSDVIFKGSGGPEGRRPANAAQATIVLENENRQFDFDADEVHVSRRVFRSGETEYLINGQTSRLKDIRSLFRGTGVGTDAYSLIEQGKVERLLQTNAKDRRAIFEEAAGISRFKAKKVEAQRRLARVEANLIRLADIVDEVGSRYRSVKAQASKAARYKEYSDRLKDLRTFVGMNDWKEYSQRMAAADEQTKTNAQEIQSLTETIQSHSELAQESELRLEGIATELQSKQEATTKVREQIADTKSTLELNQARVEDLNQRRPQLEDQHARATKASADLANSIERSAKELEAAEIKFRDASTELKQLESQQMEVEQQLADFRSSGESRRNDYRSLMAIIGEVGRLVSGAESQISSLEQSKSKSENDVLRLTDGVDQQKTSLADFKQRMEQLQTEAESKNSDLKTARRDFETAKENLEGRKDRLAELTSKHAGMSQRFEVIEELEKSLAGVNAGAVQLLQQVKTSQEGYLSEIVGLVADLVAVNVQHAGIVDVALGETSQYIVVNGHQMVDLLAQEKLQVDGRVGLIQLNDPTTLGADPEVNLNGASGVIGRADRLVQVQPLYADFIKRMLGGTWIVKTLSDAVALQKGQGRGARFVTLDGEIVEADGTVVVGPKAVSSGIVSRRSELRALTRELERLENEIGDCRQQIADQTKTLRDADSQVQQLIGENSELASTLSELKAQSASSDQQLKQFQKQLAQATEELKSSSSQLAAVSTKISADRDHLAAQELQVAALNQQMGADQTNLNQLQQRENELQRKVTAAKVQLAKWEQQLDDLEQRRAQSLTQSEDASEQLKQIQLQLESDAAARKTATENIQSAEQSLSEFSVQQESLVDEVSSLTKKRTEADSQRREVVVTLTGHRDALRLAQERAHQAKLQIDQMSMQRQQLAERLQEDYGIEIASADLDQTLTSLSEEDFDQREDIDREISELRKKLGQIGSVNLDALTELEDLESRYLKMDGQYQDLVEAKETLEKIIVRINADSRKLFVETLEAIRQNFQKLFRQTFGGGQADIILEEGVDPLEAGVEIIATPPGKPQFNNSLLSGGEKALTAVSLLMAIFQFRPSPFCVLDEVDAPFDEANIGRFIDVLKSFLGWTKFVIVTHSKKTMTAATTLYGITMQESGVSKRVSVRFEDVSEDGEISDDALKRSESEDAA